MEVLAKRSTGGRLNGSRSTPRAGHRWDPRDSRDVVEAVLLVVLVVFVFLQSWRATLIRCSRAGLMVGAFRVFPLFGSR